MGPLFVIAIWLCLAVVIGAFWLGCLVAFVIARRRKFRLIVWISGVPLLVIPAIALAVAGVVGFVVLRSTNPRYVYEDAFREAPSADVQQLRSKVWSFADEGHVYLRFQANPETIHRIVPKAMHRVSFRGYEQEMPGNNLEPPSWWHPPTAKTNEIYLGAPPYGRGAHFASETTLLTYDAATRTAFYFYIGID